MYIIKAIKKCKLFYDIEDAQIGQALDKMSASISRHITGAILSRQNDKIEEIGVIIKGGVVLFTTLADGRYKAVSHLKAGDIIGIIDVFTNAKEQRFSCVATCDTEILHIGVNVFLEDTEYYCSKLRNNALYLLAEMAYNAYSKSTQE
ncbi:MAG: cyclic nucleotide-binding domain-containing protein [Christensenellaceae bacterium]|jgi:CRP-like cAMP-binding protein|nr:cyclic nucleotide-binding domain-containing protein [Christensenellaceae bacterium]